MIRAVSFAEILPHTDLLNEYAAECSIPAIGQINPQAQMYAAMEAAGFFKCFGAFECAKMVGFASLLITVLPHYGKKLATMESLFVSPRFRAGGTGSALLHAVEDYAQAMDCEGIFYSAPTNSKLEKVLSKRSSCVRTNSVFLRSFA